MMALDELSRKLFNQGADARINGLPKKPPSHLFRHDRTTWMRGWRDADKFWGFNAQRPVKPLPIPVPRKDRR